MPAVEDLLNLDCSRALDEFVTESYNRMGIVDVNESSIGHVSGQPLMTSNYFHYTINPENVIVQDAANQVQAQQHQQPFGPVSPNIVRLPSMQELLSPSSQQQPSIDVINELFLCHDEY